MKTHTIKWLVAGAVGAGMLAFPMSAGAASSTSPAVSQTVPLQNLRLAAKDCGGVVKASAMKDDKMAKDAMKDDKMADDKMATDVAMKDDKMADDKMAKDKMTMADDCAGKKDTM